MKKLFLLLVLAAGVGCTHIDAGNVGVEVNSCSEGGVKPEPVPVGYHWTGGCTSIYEFPTYTQTLVLGKESAEDADDSVSVTSGGDSSSVAVSASVSFTVDGKKAPKIYEKFRQDMAAIKNSYVRQAVKDALQKAFAPYTAEGVHGPEREAARASAEKFLAEHLKTDGFLVTQFTINQITPPANVIAAINAKVEMVQQSAKAREAVAKATAEGDSAVAKAKAEAQATRERADAEAYANEKLSRSLSPALVEYLRVQKWNGVMPQVSGGATPLINLSPGK